MISFRCTWKVLAFHQRMKATERERKRGHHVIVRVLFGINFFLCSEIMRNFPSAWRCVHNFVNER